MFITPIHAGPKETYIFEYAKLHALHALLRYADESFIILFYLHSFRILLMTSSFFPLSQYVNRQITKPEANNQFAHIIYHLMFNIILVMSTKILMHIFANICYFFYEIILQIRNMIEGSM